MSPWEFHPALVHFPIAFLVGAVVLDLYAWRTPPERNLEKTVTGLYLVGVATAVIAALSGWLAFFTGPATFTDEAGELIWWHIGSAGGAIAAFAIVAFIRWRSPVAPPAWTRVLALIAAASLGYAGYLGGRMVYHGAAGIDSSLVSNELREKAKERQQKSP